MLNKTIGISNYNDFELPYVEAIIQIYKDEWLNSN